MNVLRQIILCAVALAAAVYIWATYVPSSAPYLAKLGIEVAQPEDNTAQRGRFQGGPAQVVTAQVSEQSLADRINAIGDGKALHSIAVRAKAVGLITELPILAGGYIEKGQVIARLEDEAETIAVEQARVRLEDAQAAAERIARLETTGAVTEVRLRETQLSLRNAELALRQAEYNLEQRKIEAPVSGYTGIIDIAVGDRVNAQDVLVTITDRSQILIDFRVPERVIGKIETGQPFTATPLGLRDVEMTGVISAVDTVVERTSRTMRVQGRLDNEADRLRAGMAFSVSLTFPGETLLSIAPLALQWSSSGPFVWVLRDGTVHRAELEIRQRNSDSILVESKVLKPGDEIVTEGVQTLREGAEVVLSEKAAAALRNGNGDRT
ncbi:efflux RND transporter periplasmic adaptor subunit [Neptunicoccus cionae]|uniref:efflux RND transporter periplasmic adaptor subunit n=1 Tax=Neptunicoccus cionae TaxID=2035344 RepID=UPI000C784CC1|nr:efflux RND transporter periplasmic adaptor subunit [Amylibacter cionae]PLS22971.1 efflux RND transporter periplasmic adaptor subunit [Amylibacter cionae]